MAIAAVDPQLASVVLVAEGNWLFARNMDIGVPGRQLNSVERGAQQRNDEHAAVDAQARENVCAGMKNLRHYIEPLNLLI